MAAPVRIELHSGASFNPERNTMAAVETAEIRVARPGGKVDGRGKPHVVLVADSRPEVLELLAGWIRSREDPDLTALADAFCGAGRVRFNAEADDDA